MCTQLCGAVFINLPACVADQRLHVHIVTTNYCSLSLPSMYVSSLMIVGTQYRNYQVLKNFQVTLESASYCVLFSRRTNYGLVLSVRLSS